MTHPCSSGYMRHWFSQRGTTGEYLPLCRRCGAANPRCPYKRFDPDNYGPVRACGRSTDDTGYCLDHRALAALP